MGVEGHELYKLFCGPGHVRGLPKSLLHCFRFHWSYWTYLGYTSLLQSKCDLSSRSEAYTVIKGKPLYEKRSQSY